VADDVEAFVAALKRTEPTVARVGAGAAQSMLREVRSHLNHDI